MSFEAKTFLRDFALPLVTGGELHIGPPVDQQDLELLQTELVLETEESVAIFAARQRHAAELWLYPVDTPLDKIALNLLVALHNLLFLSHPQIKSWHIRSKSITEVEGFTACCIKQPLPRSGAELIARHTLLRSLPKILRQDVTITYWVGRRNYIGMPPPLRLTRWRRLRRVQEERRQVRWIDTELSLGQLDMLSSLFSQSPLTDLLSPLRGTPRFSWLQVVPYLGDQQICRLICHHYLKQGLGKIGPPLAQAFWDLVDQQIDAEKKQSTIQVVVELVAYLFSVLQLCPSDDTQVVEGDSHDPTSSLIFVLLAASECGFLPETERVGDEIAPRRLMELIQSARQLLDQTTLPALVRRLETAVAA